MAADEQNRGILEKEIVAAVSCSSPTLDACTFIAGIWKLSAAARTKLKLLASNVEGRSCACVLMWHHGLACETLLAAAAG